MLENTSIGSFFGGRWDWGCAGKTVKTGSVKKRLYRRLLQRTSKTLGNERRWGG